MISETFGNSDLTAPNAPTTFSNGAIYNKNAAHVSCGKFSCLGILSNGKIFLVGKSTSSFPQEFVLSAEVGENVDQSSSLVYTTRSGETKAIDNTATEALFSSGYAGYSLPGPPSKIYGGLNLGAVNHGRLFSNSNSNSSELPHGIIDHSFNSNLVDAAAGLTFIVGLEPGFSILPYPPNVEWVSISAKSATSLTVDWWWDGAILPRRYRIERGAGDLCGRQEGSP